MYQTILYAQPKSLKPFRSLEYISEQEGKERKKRNVKVPVTDIGKSLIDILNKGSMGAKIVITNLNLKKKNYDLLISKGEVTVAFGLRPLHPGKKNARADDFYAILQCEGEKFKIFNAMKSLRSSFDRDLSDIKNFQKFSELTGIESRDEIVKDWKKVLDYDVHKEAGRGLASVKKIIARGKSMGLEMDDVEVLYENAVKAIEGKDYAQGLSLCDTAKKLGISEINKFEQDHTELQMARKKIKHTAELLREFAQEGFDTENIQNIYSDALDSLGSMNLTSCMEKCNIIENIIRHQRYKEHSIRDKLKNLEGRIKDAQALNISTDMLESLVNRVSLSLEEKDYSDAESTLDTIKEVLKEEKKKKQMLLSQSQLARQSLNEANLRMVEAKKEGLTLSKAEDYQEMAGELLNANEYSSAAEFAEKAVVEAETALLHYKESSTLLEEMKALMEGASNYIDLSEVKTELKVAENAFQMGEYNNSASILKKCRQTIVNGEEEYRPNISLELEDKMYYSDQWNRCTIVVSNEGRGHAKDLKINLGGGVEVIKLKPISFIPAKSDEKLNVGIRSGEDGDIPVDFKVTYSRAYDSQVYQAKGTIWMKFRTPGSELVEKLESGKKIENVEALEKGSIDEKLADFAENLEPTQTYLIRNTDRSIVFQVLSYIVNRGDSALCITRTFPKKIRTKYKIPEGKCRILWLTREIEEEAAIKPTELEKIGHEIRGYIDETETPFVLLEGVEYLTTHNKFESVLKLIQSLTDRVAIKEGIMAVPMDSEAFGKEKCKMLEREMDVVVEL